MPEPGSSATFVSRFSQQFPSLLWKNVLVAKRNYRSTLQRLLAPALFLLLALLLDAAIRSDTSNTNDFQNVRTPDRQEVKPIRSCSDDLFIQGDCLDFVYSPEGDSAVEEIVANIRANNRDPISEDRVRGFASLEATNEWLLTNQQKTAAGVHFTVSSATNIDFTIQANTTTKSFRSTTQDPIELVALPLQVATHREIVRYHATQANENLAMFEIGWFAFPHPARDAESTIQFFLGLFLFAAGMFNFVTMMTGIIAERENKITRSLYTMGMMRSAYWASWVIWEATFSFLITWLTIAFGAAIQLDFFRKNSVGNTFFTLFLFQLAMLGFAFMISSCIRKSSVAVILSFVIFIIGWIFQIVTISGVPYDDDIYNKWNRVLPITFSALPWVPFARAVRDLGEATTSSPGNQDLGISWANRDSYCTENCKFLLVDAWGVFIAEFILYLLVAIWLAAVLPDENGVRDPPYFFLLPSFWSPEKYRSNAICRDQVEGAPTPARIDEDVRDEAAKMRQRRELDLGERDADAAVEVYGLQRCFGGSLGGSTFWAVADSWFEIPDHQLFCLLGPNGAGKSTTINILTGVLPPSGGDAIMAGESIRSPGGLSHIRSTIGVCPQFDVLWNELTGKEHMVIFGNMKGLGDKATVNEETDQLLGEVNLSKAAGVRVGTYSGGMKRRLSVAMALLGDPTIIFLDEPTTGMDPVSRRQVWDIIEREKQKRAVILTTHSMEEADILGDKVAIMAKGSLRALGSSLRLKQKFGAGYQVSVSVLANEDRVDELALAQRVAAVKDLVQSRFQLTPVEETNAYMTFLVGREQAADLPTLLKELETRRTELAITDIQIALTTLEEVFLNIAKEAEIEAAGEDAAVQVTVEDGVDLRVPLGGSAVSNPNTGIMYRLWWAQDDRGALVFDRAERLAPAAPAHAAPAQSAAPPAAPLQPAPSGETSLV